MATPPVFLSGESHGQGSLVGYGSWGHKESDTTETHSSLRDLTRGQRERLGKEALWKEGCEKGKEKSQESPFL